MNNNRLPNFVLAMHCPLRSALRAFLYGALFAIAFSGLGSQGHRIFAQDDGGPQPITSRALAAIVDYGNDAVFEPAKHGVDFDLLGLRPEQAVSLTVQFPVELAGQIIIAEPLDGGILTVPEEGLVVGADGTVVMPFQASDMPGACRIAVHQPDDHNVLHFWIIDLEHPENNPPDLPGAY